MIDFISEHFEEAVVIALSVDGLLFCMGLGFSNWLCDKFTW